MDISKVIAVDFDGTLCENEWPGIGAANQDLIEYLQNQQDRGVKLILWTCRSGVRLDEAITWCEQHYLRFDAVNENLPELIERFGEDTRKIFADESIDDRMSNKVDLPYQKKKKNV